MHEPRENDLTSPLPKSYTPTSEVIPSVKTAHPEAETPAEASSRSSTSSLLDAQNRFSRSGGEAGGAAGAEDVVRSHEGVKAVAGRTGDMGEGRITQAVLPPSPPLTRPSSTMSGQGDGVNEAAQLEGEWHMLEHEANVMDSTQDDTMVQDEEGTEKLGASLVFKNPNEKSSPPLANANLRIVPHSPQPWDLIEPPETNGDRDIYSTVGSRKFSTLQKAAQGRPAIPQSSYYFGPPPSDAAYGTRPTGQIGLHHPREILRVERDYTGGELIQFAPIYPLELEGRLTPTQFLESINAMNEILISAHSLTHAFMDNALAVFTLQTSRLFRTTHYIKEMRKLERLFQDLNTGMYNPAGLNLVWPRKVAFLFLEIEYY